MQAMRKNRFDDVTAWLCLMLFVILFLISIASIIFIFNLPKQTIKPRQNALSEEVNQDRYNCPCCRIESVR